MASLKLVIDITCTIATGITLSKEQVRRGSQLAQERGLSNCSFQVMNALSMDFPDDSFDLVWACESGEHMPDKGKYIEEMVRVLKPGGCLLGRACSAADGGPASQIAAATPRARASWPARCSQQGCEQGMRRPVLSGYIPALHGGVRPGILRVEMLCIPASCPWSDSPCCKDCKLHSVLSAAPWQSGMSCRRWRPHDCLVMPNVHDSPQL